MNKPRKRNTKKKSKKRKLTEQEKHEQLQQRMITNDESKALSEDLRNTNLNEYYAATMSIDWKTNVVQDTSLRTGKYSESLISQLMKDQGLSVEEDNATDDEEFSHSDSE